MKSLVFKNHLKIFLHRIYSQCDYCTCVHRDVMIHIVPLHHQGKFPPCQTISDTAEAVIVV